MLYFFITYVLILNELQIGGAYMVTNSIYSVTGKPVTYAVAERANREAKFMLKYKLTVRAAAKALGVAKSTLHNDITYHITDVKLYEAIRVLMLQHTEERAMNGGIATKRVYEERRNKSMANLSSSSRVCFYIPSN